MDFVMNFHIITIFPEMFDSYLNESIIERAIKDKKIKVKFYNPRNFTDDKHKKVDDRPYGGGPGMVMYAEPIIKIVEKINKTIKQPARHASQGEAGGENNKTKIILFSPSGKKFTNKYAENTLKKYTDIILICGRYEGIDARVKKILRAEEISIGDYILTGGELPAMVMVDSITRRISGVLGSDESIEENRISSSEVYTRPEVIEHEGNKFRVPKILLSGHHEKIEKWKIKKTKKQ